MGTPVIFNNSKEMIILKITEELIVTEMSLDGFKIKVPEGFSELLNRAGAWEYVDPNLPKKEEEDFLKNYDRKVVRENGKLRVYLTYKG